MRSELSHLPNSELEIMLILWEAGRPLARTEIEERLCGRQKWGPTTILKFLSRLREKGFVLCETEMAQKRNLYAACICEEDYLAYESRSVMGRLCGRSVKNLVANLYENHTIDDRELEELRRFLDQQTKRG